MMLGVEATWTHFRPVVPGIRPGPFLASLTIDRRDLLSLAAGAIALLGLILLAVGALTAQVIVLLAGVVAIAGGAGILAGQRRRVRV
jgi:hypothetical protein